jgi:succinyl-CoA synthetase alpha subunit
VLDMVRVKRALSGSKSRLIGPNCPGVITPASARSASCRATSSSRARSASSRAPARSPTRRCSRPPSEGLGQTTAVGIGGDPVKGTEFIDVLEMFLGDEKTKSIVMIGEIGGSAEEDAAAVPQGRGQARPQEADGGLHRRRTAPPGRRMGHAGAIISGGKGGAEDKIAAMEAAGIKVSPSPARLGIRWSRC